MMYVASESIKYMYVNSKFREPKIDLKFPFCLVGCKNFPI